MLQDWLVKISGKKYVGSMRTWKDLFCARREDLESFGLTIGVKNKLLKERDALILQSLTDLSSAGELTLQCFSTVAELSLCPLLCACVSVLLFSSLPLLCSSIHKIFPSFPLMVNCRTERTKKKRSVSVEEVKKVVSSRHTGRNRSHTTDGGASLEDTQVREMSRRLC